MVTDAAPPHPFREGGARRVQMSVHDEGSVARLLRLCGGYFFFYVLTGVSVKYCQGPTSKGLLGIEPMAFLAC